MDDFPIKNTAASFRVCDQSVGRGFEIVLGNGIAVSVRWGISNYSDGRTSAEITAFNKNRELVTVDGYNEDGLQFASPEQVVQFMSAASHMEEVK